MSIRNKIISFLTIFSAISLPFDVFACSLQRKALFITKQPLSYLPYFLLCALFLSFTVLFRKKRFWGAFFLFLLLAIIAFLIIFYPLESSKIICSNSSNGEST